MSWSRRRRTVAGVLVAAFLLAGAGVTTVLLAADLVAVRRAAAEQRLTAEEAEAWTLPPSVFGRADAEVLDVDRYDGRASMDVAYLSAGRTRNVAWVDVSHLASPPAPGDTVTVAYDPHDTEIVFDLEDPGLSDPQGNGYLAWAPVAPEEPVVGHLALRGGLAVGLVVFGGACLVATVAAHDRRAGLDGQRGLSPAAGP